MSKSLILSIHCWASWRLWAASKIRGLHGSSIENTANACGRVRDLARFTMQPVRNSTVPAGEPASLQYTASEPPPALSGLGRRIHHCRFHDCQLKINNSTVLDYRPCTKTNKRTLKGFRPRFDLKGYFTSK